jgi:hypothetical protein
MRTNMTGLSVIRHDIKMLRKWFGPNRGTHWSIAGSVAVIIFSSYLIYHSRDSNPASAAGVAAAERIVIPMTPGPFTLKK